MYRIWIRDYNHRTVADGECDKPLPIFSEDVKDARAMGRVIAEYIGKCRGEHGVLVCDGHKIVYEFKVEVR